MLRICDNNEISLKDFDELINSGDSIRFTYLQDKEFYKHFEYTSSMSLIYTCIKDRSKIHNLKNKVNLLDFYKLHPDISIYYNNNLVKHIHDTIIPINNEYLDEYIV